MKYERAKQLAMFAHNGQKYGSHDYYQHHLLGVVALAEQHHLSTDLNIDDVRCVAVLHDILEDTQIDSHIIRYYFGEDVVTAVRLLTRDEGVSKACYLNGIKENRLALLVKIADTLFNLKESALNGNFTRVKKYTDQLNSLMS